MRDFKNPNWWSQLVAQIVTVLALLGIFNAEEAKGVEDAAAKAIAAAAVVIANVWLIRGIIHDRQKPTESDEPPPPTLPIRPVLIAWLCLGAAQATAQERSAFRPEQVDGRAVKTAYDACCGRQQQLSRRPVDDEVLAELRALRTEQARLLAMLEQIQRTPPAAPAPGSPIIVLPPGGSPRYELPPGGTPRYDLPPGGTPPITLPPGGTPPLTLPPGGTPRMDLPGGGGTLRMDIPPGGAIRMDLPGQSKPVPLTPGEAKPGPIVPGELRGEAPPTGYMRYTLWR